jgi:MFS family permease
VQAGGGIVADSDPAAEDAECLNKARAVLSAVATAATALAFGFLARDYASGLALYTLVALSQGGVYTPGIMLLAEWYDPRRRGSAVGWFIASTSVAYAFSLLASGLMLAWGGYRLAFVGTGLLPVVGAAILWAALRHTPNTVPERAAGRGLAAAVWKHANTRRLVAGYTCHSWELLGMWAWTPAFLAASLVVSGRGSGRAVEAAAYLTAAMHVAGALASSTTGRLSDVLGRRAVLIALAAVAAALSLAFGWLLTWSVPILVALALIYGAAAIGDSPVLSAALTEAVAPGQLGSVLAVRSLLGFGAGAISPLAFGLVLDLGGGEKAAAAWGPAFMVLGIGGLGATWYAWRFRPAAVARASPELVGGKDQA